MIKETSLLSMPKINVRGTMFFRAVALASSCAALLLTACATPMNSELGKAGVSASEGHLLKGVGGELAAPVLAAPKAQLAVLDKAPETLARDTASVSDGMGRDSTEYAATALADAEGASGVGAPDGATNTTAPSPERLAGDISMHPVAGAGEKTAASNAVSPAPATPSRPVDVAVAVSAVQPNLFGTIAMPVGRTPEDGKWIRARSLVLSAGEGPWAQTLRAARGAAGVRRLEIVNGWVNHRIAYATPEVQYGQADYWATGRESLSSGRGNCTAYALAKIELLRAAGIAPQDIYLVLVKDLVRRADHAIVAVRVDGRFVILDSGSDAVLSPEAVHDYRPILTYGYGRTWIHGYHEAPTLTLASSGGSASF